MYGIVGLASALLVTMAFLGSAGAPALLDEDGLPTIKDPTTKEERTDTARETLVEGHTVYVVLDITEADDVTPRPKPPMRKAAECIENQPGDWDIHEECTAFLGPIDPPQDDRVTDAYIEEVNAHVKVGFGETMKAVAAWLNDLV